MLHCADTYTNLRSDFIEIMPKPKTHLKYKRQIGMFIEYFSTMCTSLGTTKMLHFRIKLFKLDLYVCVCLHSVTKLIFKQREKLI